VRKPDAERRSLEAAIEFLRSPHRLRFEIVLAPEAVDDLRRLGARERTTVDACPQRIRI